MLDPPAFVWIDWIKKNIDPNFVDDEPKIGPQIIDWRQDAGDGLPEWNGRFDELNNSDEDVVGIYCLSDDEEVTSNIDCYIEKTERNEEKVRKKRGLRQNIRRLWADAHGFCRSKTS